MSDALNLWFFRDLNDDQRLKLFGLFGLPIDEIGAHHGRQSVALKQVTQSLIKMVTKEVSPSPQTHLFAACQGIADDYMTSETHHPGWVLIPQAKFEAICAALYMEGRAYV